MGWTEFMPAWACNMTTGHAPYFVQLSHWKFYQSTYKVHAQDATGSHDDGAFNEVWGVPSMQQWLISQSMRVLRVTCATNLVVKSAGPARHLQPPICYPIVPMPTC